MIFYVSYYSSMQPDYLLSSQPLVPLIQCPHQDRDQPHCSSSESGQGHFGSMTHSDTVVLPLKSSQLSKPAASAATLLQPELQQRCAQCAARQATGQTRPITARRALGTSSTACAFRAPRRHCYATPAPASAAGGGASESIDAVTLLTRMVRSPSARILAAHNSVTAAIATAIGRVIATSGVPACVCASVPRCIGGHAHVAQQHTVATTGLAYCQRVPNGLGSSSRMDSDALGTWKQPRRPRIRSALP
jgi:hypothetical protein